MMLKERRKQKGITQKELATAVDVSISTVAQWEKENFIPLTKDWSNVSNFYGVTMGELAKTWNQVNRVNDLRLSD